METEEIANDSERGQAEQIRDYLLAGATKKQLEVAGFNSNSIRTIRSELKSQGKYPPKNAPASPGGNGVKGDQSQAVTERETSAVAPVGNIQVYQRGSPPEALINAVAFPPEMDSGVFESGLKFGMSLIVLGVRVAQELSQVGVQQAKPLIELSREMRKGEAEAARSAATEAAFEAATSVGKYFEPILTKLAGEGAGRPAGPNPMAEMLTRIMEPLLKRTMGGLIPGGAQDEGSTPTGWKRTRL